MANDRLKLSWDTIHDGLESISMMVQNPRIGPSIMRVVGVSRGGLIPATLLSHKFGVPLEVITCSSYTGTSRTTDPVVVGWKPEFNDPRTLVVDDILDSGDTYSAILKAASQSTSAKFQFATLVNKQCVRFGEFKNYFVQVPKEVWVQFPWETIDTPF